MKDHAPLSVAKEKHRMYTDTEFVRSLANYNRLVERHVGPLTLETMPIYYQEMNRYVRYLQQYGLANEEHLKRYVLGTVKRLINHGRLVTPEVIQQISHNYGYRFEQFKNTPYEIEHLTDAELSHVLSPVVFNEAGNIMAIMLIGKSAQEAA
jgi:hypothetical protein